ncbi:MAG: hypothetical protein VX223_18115, partial [Myxococcota bacterium]|nr:hypothetical protein [Myxococcota bacterium]
HDSSDLKSKLCLGDLFHRTGDMSGCLKSYADVAYAYASDGEFLRAVAVYRHMLRLDDGLHAVHVALARVYDQMGLLNDAVSEYQEALAVLAQRGQQLERLRVIRELLELDPENLRARIRLAEDFLAEGAIEDGVNELRSAALLLKNGGRSNEFLSVADRLLYFQPDDAGIARRVAAMHMERELPQQALLRLQACFRADPNDTDVLNMLASCFMSLGQGHKALIVLRELARIHDRNGLIIERNEALERVLEIDPSDQSALRVLQGRVASMPVEEELGFDELAFDDEGASDSSQGFGDESSFSAAEDYSSRERSVSRVEFDDLEALAELVASEPLGTADLGSVRRTDIASENKAAHRHPDGSSNTGGSASEMMEDESEAHVLDSVSDSALGSVIPGTDVIENMPGDVARLHGSIPTGSDDVLEGSSEAVDPSSDALGEPNPETLASLEDLVDLVSSESMVPPLPVDADEAATEDQDVMDIVRQDAEVVDATELVPMNTQGPPWEKTEAKEQTSTISDGSDPSENGRTESAASSHAGDDGLGESPAAADAGNDDDTAQVVESKGNGARDSAFDELPDELVVELKQWDFYAENGFVREAKVLLESLLLKFGYRPELLVRKKRMEELSE